ncbi:hypothetical protein SUDANB146_00482 [Streptomyces sp. enrichment culture]
MVHARAERRGAQEREVKIAHSAIPERATDAFRRFRPAPHSPSSGSTTPASRSGSARM